MGTFNPISNEEITLDANLTKGYNASVGLHARVVKGEFNWYY
jgi:hypothetical protein